MNGGKAKLKVVKTGIQDDTNIEIISGLVEGDEIITGPYNMVSKTLKPGDKIKNKDKRLLKKKRRIIILKNLILFQINMTYLWHSAKYRNSNNKLFGLSF